MKLDLGSMQLGVATAATQIEGGEADTNWHHWADDGRVKDGSSPRRAADHWDRFDEDIALLKSLGITHYRMGLEWARLEPTPGVFDGVAIDHYRSELAALRDAGITPLVTLHHFNNPWWLERTGGWRVPGTIAVFLAYVRLAVSAFSDLVTDWVTINEPNVYAIQGYVFGDWPPGVKQPVHGFAVMSHLAQAHCRAYNLIHALQPESRVGVAHHVRVFDPANPRNPVDRAGASSMEYLFQTAVMDAMNDGHFRQPLRGGPQIGRGRYYDFLGLNYYTRSWVTGVSQGTRPGAPVNDLGWEIYPEGLTRLLTELSERYPAPVYITENGTADAADAWRARFLYDHWAAIRAADATVERYYHWCFTDNWEWIEGEGPRFGLVELDYETQARRPRASAEFVADVIAQGGVTDQAYQRWVAPQEYQH